MNFYQPGIIVYSKCNLLSHRYVHLRLFAVARHCKIVIH